MSGSSSHFHSNRGVKRKNNDHFPFLLVKVKFRVITILNENGWNKGASKTIPCYPQNTSDV
uniref:Uncharacterized protein n=1 Tax=Magallana gigas TaxID=29159 RepID=K1QNK0_MAGGI